MNALTNNKSSYYDGVRYEMVRFIPKSTKTFLDVGCGNGKFGEFLKNQFNNAIVWGAEVNTVAANKAIEKLDKVVVGDVSGMMEKLPDNYFDCVSFNDSLEHMVDPFDVLLKIKCKLSRDGVVVSSIPNVRYFDNLRDLIFKKQWEYVDEGILDRTHLRFFTEKSITTMYKRLGYDIEEMEGINRTGNKKARLLIKLTFRWLQDIQYLQFATRAKPK
jgi:2-polyprenyl-3-methyl-5-hydroxy-6-metoxy-1,4-benzoquinol methylase